MKRKLFQIITVTLAMIAAYSWGTTTRAFAADDCSQFPIDPQASSAFGQGSSPSPGSCRIRLINGFPVPDSTCTPGAVNPTVTAEILRNRAFRTGCLRNLATSEQHKSVTYEWYGVPHPSNNSGPTQICELDHYVPLELGGADTLDNIWPQCGPAGVKLEQRYFKMKDTVENYLTWAVKSGRMELSIAQRGIASDWTQYLDAAERTCPGGHCPNPR
jgi:hypothetical protein